MTYTDEDVERAARAMEPNAYAVFDLGATSQNVYDNRRFLNAEKIVKRARKRARAALSSLPTLPDAREGWRLVPVEADMIEALSSPPPATVEVMDSCGCVFCDLALDPIHENRGWMHYGNSRINAMPCTHPRRIAALSTQKKDGG